ncbi:DUF2281 domain-containing protein [Pseudanabaena sp. 'Roaring Creek']|uniref:DUF2281 domain-containing protein n=1 Tax=Pseudanabaena sp. 'Roaring Creek' TaxID=1681830 RepID=UPI0009E69569
MTKLQKLPESLVQEVNQFIESLTKRQTQEEKSTLSAYDLSKQYLSIATIAF